MTQNSSFVPECEFFVAFRFHPRSIARIKALQSSVRDALLKEGISSVIPRTEPHVMAKVPFPLERRQAVSNARELNKLFLDVLERNSSFRQIRITFGLPGLFTQERLLYLSTGIATRPMVDAMVDSFKSAGIQPAKHDKGFGYTTLVKKVTVTKGGGAFAAVSPLTLPVTATITELALYRFKQGRWQPTTVYTLPKN